MTLPMSLTADALWVTAAADHDSAEEDRLVATARAACTDVWPFLAAAASRADFENRKFLAADRIDAAVDRALAGDVSRFIEVRSMVESVLDGDYEALARHRTAESQARNAPRAFARAATRTGADRTAGFKVASERYRIAKDVLDHGIYDDAGQTRKLEGAILDHVTASMLVQMYESLSPENQAKFDSVPLQKLLDLGWKRVGRREQSPRGGGNPFGSSLGRIADLNWTEVGKGVNQGEVLNQIAQLEWHPVTSETMSLPMAPGEAIKKLISEFRIPKVSAIAYNGILQNRYGFYGIEGNYKNGRARIYVMDKGSVLTPVASELLTTASKTAAANYYANDPRWIEARYSGVCMTCGATVRAGDRAWFWPSRAKRRQNSIECSTCGEVSERRFESEVADEEFMSGRTYSKTAADKPNPRVAGEGAYITNPYMSSIRNDVPPGTVARPGQAYNEAFLGLRYDWIVDGFEGEWKLGGNWTEQTTAAYNPLRDPESAYNKPDKGPHKGTPDDLFPEGVPLKGDLTPEQEEWLKSRKRSSAESPPFVSSAERKQALGVDSYCVNCGKHIVSVPDLTADVFGVSGQHWVGPDGRDTCPAVENPIGPYGYHVPGGKPTTEDLLRDSASKTAASRDELQQQANATASGLGHDLRWETYDDKVSFGTCSHCNMTATADADHGARGPALEHDCNVESGAAGHFEALLGPGVTTVLGVHRLRASDDVAVFMAGPHPSAVARHGQRVKVWVDGHRAEGALTDTADLVLDAHARAQRYRRGYIAYNGADGYEFADAMQVASSAIKEGRGRGIFPVTGFVVNASGELVERPDPMTDDALDALVGFKRTADLDHCPTCGKKITDYDMTGMEAGDGQRWCVDHAPQEVRDLIGPMGTWLLGSKTAGDAPPWLNKDKRSDDGGDKPKGDSGGDKPADKPAEAGDLDPTQMQPGQQVQVHYTLTGEASDEGDVSASFEQTDGQWYHFTADTGPFAVQQDGGKWVDSAGTEFTFAAGAPTPDQSPAPGQDQDPKPPVQAAKEANNPQFSSLQLTAEQMRNMSPQAWRRLRATMTEGELRDLAKDLAAEVGGDADAIASALTSTDWESRRQALLRTANNPYMPQDNPFLPQGATPPPSQAPTGTPGDMMDGGTLTPPGPPAPRQTDNRQTPGGAPAPGSSNAAPVGDQADNDRQRTGY